MCEQENTALPTLNDLESLFVNNPDLDRVRSHLGRFNPIKTMGMERMEIRHSAILGWLLNPQETHGLGDRFLKAFLSEALRGANGDTKPSALDVSQADMMDAEIRREWRHIDLLVLSPRNGWVFVIENKFDSTQHSKQLSRYMDLAQQTFVDGDSFTAARGVFLTLWEEAPEDGRYAPLEYASVCDLLARQALSGQHPLTAEVEMFITHYLDIIREAAGMSEHQKEMEKLARQIYRDHSRVLDFIVEHGKATDFRIACDSVFGEDLEHQARVLVENCDLVFFHADSHMVSFFPQSWFNALGGDQFYWHGCEEWWSGFPLIMWIQLTSSSESNRGQVRLFAEVGPLADHDFRKDLIEAITAVAQAKGLQKIKFQRGAADEGRKYSKFLKQNFFPVDDIHDHEKISSAIRKAIKTFSPEIAAVAEVLPRFVSHGKAEASQ